MFTGYSEQLLIWNTTTGKVIKRISPTDVENGRALILSLAVSPDSRRAVTVDRPPPGGDETIVRVWDLATGAQIKKLDKLQESSEVAFSPDGKRLASPRPSCVPLRMLWTWKRGRRLPPFRRWDPTRGRRFRRTAAMCWWTIWISRPKGRCWCGTCRRKSNASR